ncbi:MAG: hypothetical protein IKR89_01610 [Bacteroidaceae bacterium]|nr:hypothetical protein [Bacteroidaceae bacterium]
MRKTIISATMLLASLTAMADNAVVLTTKSGEQKFVAFEDNVVMTTNSNKQLVLTSGNEVLTLSIADIASIRTQEYDFSGTTAVDSVEADGGKCQIFDLNGRKINSVTPGQIYIIKKGNKTSKEIAK